MWSQNSVAEKLIQPPTVVIGMYILHTRDNYFPLLGIPPITHGRLCPSLKKKNILIKKKHVERMARMMWETQNDVVRGSFKG